MGHSDLQCEDIPAINLIIGRNDTGKTGLLKLLYATGKALEIYTLKKKSGDASFKKELAEKLLNTFMPRKHNLGELVQKGRSEKLEVGIHFSIPTFQYNQSIHFSFGNKTEDTIPHSNDEVNLLPSGGMNVLFIPAKEVLTAYNDIRSMRESFYGRGFDDTYLDLIKALSLEPTHGRTNGALRGVNKELENLFEGKIEYTGQSEQPFLFKKGNQLFAMQQTAEGIKKIGILNNLIANGQLDKGTVLFMDEPETALHPDAVRALVEMLVAMSKNGVQLFLATHSYFVIKQLALCAKRDTLNILCWSLEKKQDLVSHSFNRLIAGILPDNSIVNEALAMYNDDLKLSIGL
ncbi:MAG TPA: AAA family ATPase [Saprospiraceae bacterium]|nr:AAA family ATPase [Saprospiraceae bacterium]